MISKNHTLWILHQVLVLLSIVSFVEAQKPPPTPNPECNGMNTAAKSFSNTLKPIIKPDAQCKPNEHCTGVSCSWSGGGFLEIDLHHCHDPVYYHLLLKYPAVGISAKNINVTEGHEHTLIKQKLTAIKIKVTKLERTDNMVTTTVILETCIASLCFPHKLMDNQAFCVRMQNCPGFNASAHHYTPCGYKLTSPATKQPTSTTSASTGPRTKQSSSDSTDINECMDHNGHCQHICTDLAFGYKCSCHSGYTLAENQRSCEGPATKQPTSTTSASTGPRTRQSSSDSTGPHTKQSSSASTGPHTKEPTSASTGAPTKQSSSASTGPHTKQPTSASTGPHTKQPTSASTGPHTKQSSSASTGLHTIKQPTITTSVSTGPHTEKPSSTTGSSTGPHTKQESTSASTGPHTRQPTSASRGPRTEQPTSPSTGHRTKQSTSAPTGPHTKQPSSASTGPHTKQPTSASRGPRTEQPTSPSTGPHTKQPTSASTGPHTEQPTSASTAGHIKTKPSPQHSPSTVSPSDGTILHRKGGEGDNKKGLSTAAVIGICVAAVVAILVVVGVVVYWKKYRYRSRLRAAYYNDISMEEPLYNDFGPEIA